MMIEQATPPIQPTSPPGSPQVPPLELSARADRVEWLFRDALRRRQVHPLMALLRRYRGLEGS